MEPFSGFAKAAVFLWTGGNVSVRPRGGAVSLHSEEASSAGVFPGQSQRGPSD